MTIRIVSSKLVNYYDPTAHKLTLGTEWPGERWVAIYAYSTASSSGFGAYVTNFLGSS